jgi:putative phosphoesterase
MPYLEQALACSKNESPDKIVLLGDILYHGPRNPLPEGYDPKMVADALNDICHLLIAVRGNCDSEVDQMVLDFPILSDYASLFFENRYIFATHGHVFNIDALPPLNINDILIHGHTHIPVAEKRGDIFLLNPGSISLPKENTPRTFGIMENHQFTIKTLDGNVYKQISL